MRKLTILAVVVTLVCGAVIVTVPALCHQAAEDSRTLSPLVGELWDSSWHSAR